MAVLVNIKCSVCGKNTQEVIAAGTPCPLVCHNCRKFNDDDHRTYVLAGLKALPLETRISRIEQWIYDYKPTHVPPPRF